MSMGRGIPHKICAGVTRAVTREIERDEFSMTDPHVAVGPSYLLALSVEDEH